MKDMLQGWYGYGKRKRHNSSGSDSTTSDHVSVTATVFPTPGHVSPVTVGSASPDLQVTADECKPPCSVVCSWCNKLGTQLYNMGSKSYCSEPCFSQSRAANFRKTKLCDWCKNIRDALNLEYINGDQQLQFCSESCLNAYKMNVFCTETEAHMQMHPHLRVLAAQSPEEVLITPDLWLRDSSSDPNGASSADKLAPSIHPPAVKRRGRSGRGRSNATASSPQPVGLRAPRQRLSPTLSQPQAPQQQVLAPQQAQAPQQQAQAPQQQAQAPQQQTPQQTHVPQQQTQAQQQRVQAHHKPQVPIGGVTGKPHVDSAWSLAPSLSIATMLLPLPVFVPVPVVVPVPESLCRALLAQVTAGASPPSPPRRNCSPTDHKRHEPLEGATIASGVQGLDLSVRRWQPATIKMEEDDFD